MHHRIPRVAVDLETGADVCWGYGECGFRLMETATPGVGGGGGGWVGGVGGSWDVRLRGEEGNGGQRKGGRRAYIYELKIEP
jgi:hypothetical protein